jgi:hypothetical protein
MIGGVTQVKNQNENPKQCCSYCSLRHKAELSALRFLSVLDNSANAFADICDLF